MADFNGGKTTSDAGALLLRQVDKCISLIDAISDCIPDPRNPSLTRHDQRAMLVQRIYAITVGYEDLNDHQSLRNDPVMQTITEHGRQLRTLVTLALDIPRYLAKSALVSTLLVPIKSPD